MQFEHNLGFQMFQPNTWLTFSIHIPIWWQHICRMIPVHIWWLCFHMMKSAYKICEGWHLFGSLRSEIPKKKKKSCSTFLKIVWNRSCCKLFGLTWFGFCSTPSPSPFRPTWSRNTGSGVGVLQIGSGWPPHNRDPWLPCIIRKCCTTICLLPMKNRYGDVC